MVWRRPSQSRPAMRAIRRRSSGRRRCITKTGLPSTVAPAGFTSEGLPVGVQIVGPQYGDHTCIHFARLLEQEFQGFVPPAGFAELFKTRPFGHYPVGPLL